MSANVCNIEIDNLRIQSLNIDNTFTPKIAISPENFAKGNMHRYLDTGVDTNIKLINLFEISFQPVQSTLPIISLRYGTPFKSKNETDDENLYKIQCQMIRDYLNVPPQPSPSPKKRRGIIISLIDMVKPCFSDKCKEVEIIETENAFYTNDENIVFINMSINNNVNWGVTSACPSQILRKEYCDNVEKYLNKLMQWCEQVSSKSDKYDSLIFLLQFWPAFKTNVIKNEIHNSLQEFCNRVMTNTFKREQDTMPNEVCRLIMFCYISLIVYVLNVNDNEYEYVLMYHCKSGQDRTGTFYAINQMVNEITRTYYDEIMLKMKQLEPIISKEGALLSKGDVFWNNRYFKFYSNGLLERYDENDVTRVRGSHFIGTNTQIESEGLLLKITDSISGLKYNLKTADINDINAWVKILNDFKTNPYIGSFVGIYDTFYNMKRIINQSNQQQSLPVPVPNKTLYDSIMKHMLFSYFVTYTSAGVPGIKWNLGKEPIQETRPQPQEPQQRSFFGNIKYTIKAIPENINKMIKGENRFPYLLFPSPEISKLFEGGSKLRGA
jgi:hypothetical protein